MPEQFDQIKYQNEYNKQKYDRITIMAPKGMKEKLQEAARVTGMRSVNEFILAAIEERIRQEK